MHGSAVRVALLTPPGRGALAVVGVAGTGAVALVMRSFVSRAQVSLDTRPDGAVVFGRWGDAERGEEVVVVRHGPDRLEVHCHGGLAASTAIMEALDRLGAVRIPWQEWLAAGGESSIDIEARETLARAGGPKAAQILARQLAGALETEFSRIAALEATGDLRGAADARARLLRAARVGLRLTRPWRVAVVGEVNAGKSSLVNALAGHARSIVSAEPGTTRDVLETRVVLDGWEIDIVDTAGLRAAPDGPTEAAGIDRAIATAAGADLVLRVVDVREAGHRQAEACPTGSLLVLSKCDLVAEHGVMPPDAIRTSAMTGLGIDTLAAAIVHRLVPEEQDEPDLLAGAVPFTVGQASACRRHP